MFPESFVFGTATSAYQVEGATKEGGRGPSIWDEFSHAPGKTLNGDTGDVACDQYHRYEEDIALMAEIGWRAHRFSISWSRVLPEGAGRVNEEGVAYYNRLIDALIARGITPYVTLFHWDLPLALHRKDGGFLSSGIVAAFREYAELCFERFGDRVRHWMTFNEPLTFSTLGYGTGEHAPGRCTDRRTCPAGDSATEPYLVVHHILLAHAAAANAYRSRFQGAQGGTIGIAADCEWAEPLSQAPRDAAAAQRRLEFLIGWVLDPLFKGDYPQCMKERVGPRLPAFTPAQSRELMSAGLDFLGLNHYTSRYVADRGQVGPTPSFFSDQGVTLSAERDGAPIGWQAASPWLIVVPWGIRKLLLWLTERYGEVPVFITENGLDEWDDPELPLEAALADEHRIRYYNDYLLNVAHAMRDGANVQGYFAWSFMDNFEWQRGYASRFGLVHVDWTQGSLVRRPKASALQWKGFLDSKTPRPMAAMLH